MAKGRAAELKSHFFGTRKHDASKIARAIAWNNSNPEGARAMETPLRVPGKHRAGPASESASMPMEPNPPASRQMQFQNGKARMAYYIAKHDAGM